MILCGDQLVDLTSLEGDWFFHDVYNLNNNVINHMQLVQSHIQNPETNLVFDVMKAIKEVIDNIQMLELDSLNMFSCTDDKTILVPPNSFTLKFPSHSLNFHKLNSEYQKSIQPEIISLICCQDPGILSIVNSIDKIINESNSELDTIITNMESHMRCLIMEMKSGSVHTTTIMGKTSDLTVVQKTLIDTIHKEGKPQKIIAERLGSSQSVSPYQEVLTKMEEIKRKYQELLNSMTGNSAGTLFIGFNTLIENLHSSLENVIRKSNNLSFPQCWRKIKIINEAKAFQAPISVNQAQAVLTDILMLKRLKTFQKIFHSCQKSVDYQYGIHVKSVEEMKIENNQGFGYCDEDNLYQPIKIFISDFISKQLLGLPSQFVGYAVCSLMDELKIINVSAEIEQKDVGALNKVSLEDLYKKMLDNLLQAQLVQPVQLTQASNLTSNLDSVWKNADTERWKKESIEWTRSCLERAKLQLTRHHWFYEDLLLSASSKSYQNYLNPLRSTIRNASEDISSIRHDFVTALTDQIKLRFPKQSADIGTAFGVLGLRNLTFLSQEQQESHGDDKIQILADFYGKKQRSKGIISQPLLQHGSIFPEWSLAKTVIKKEMYPRDNMLLLWQVVKKHHGETFPNLLKLVAIALGVQSLIATESALSTNNERFTNLFTSVEQRLKWAAGANPSLTSVSENFELSVVNETQKISLFMDISKELTSITNGILHFEAHRTKTVEALNYDASFVKFLSWCGANCKVIESSNVQVSLVEEKLLQTNSLKNGEKISNEWVDSVKLKIKQQLEDKENSISDIAEACFIQTDTMKTQVVIIRNVLSQQHHLMSEIRSVLKTIVKHEEIDETEKNGNLNIQGYTDTYKQFSERMSRIILILQSSENLEVETVENIVDSHCEDFLREIENGKIYEDLIKLAHPLDNIIEKNRDQQENHNGHNAGQSKPISCQEDGLSKNEGSSNTTAVLPSKVQISCKNSSETNSPSDKSLVNSKKLMSVQHHHHPGKEQKRNFYAMNVWKRVKLKLDGRDLNPSQRSSVAEQVEYAINQATSLDNLAVLYEGLLFTVVFNTRYPYYYKPVLGSRNFIYLA
ncbi:Serine/threonine-protein kinase SMG1 [Nymphon striatum]|nr:Serine/threonine-protein kinase SMG1 [Nymphon striatum]